MNIEEINAILLPMGWVRYNGLISALPEFRIPLSVDARVVDTTLSLLDLGGTHHSIKHTKYYYYLTPISNP